MNDAEFKRLYPHTTTAELQVMLACSRSVVTKRAHRLGLRKSPEHITRQATLRATGKTRSSETREKIAAKARGRTVAPEVTARRIATLKRSGANAGPNHYKWKGGLTWPRFADPEYITWRSAVLDRDKYLCQDCKRKCRKHEKGLAAHHIKSYAQHPDLRLDLNNGITLCRECHMARHGRAPTPKTPVLCACGCGSLMSPVDRYGRPRRFINHHNSRAPKPCGGCGVPVE
jgi:hypothetical protein